MEGNLKLIAELKSLPVIIPSPKAFVVTLKFVASQLFESFMVA